MMHVPYRILVAESLNKSQIERLEAIIIQTFHHIDHVYNHWNPSSEISSLSKASGKTAVSPELYEMLLKVDELYHKSEGRFDVTINPLLKLWKQGKPTEAALSQMKPALGFDKVHLENKHCIKDCPQTSFDLGGIAKGYAVDLLTKNLTDEGFSNICVDWGGEICTRGKHPSGRPWKIGIQKQSIVVELDNQSIATSGYEYQFWNIEGIDYTHIIDPRTMTPLIKKAHNINSVTVVAPSCLMADALATILMLFETPQEAKNWLSTNYPDAKCWIYIE